MGWAPRAPPPSAPSLRRAAVFSEPLSRSRPAGARRRPRWIAGQAALGRPGVRVAGGIGGGGKRVMRCRALRWGRRPVRRRRRRRGRVCRAVGAAAARRAAAPPHRPLAWGRAWPPAPPLPTPLHPEVPCRCLVPQRWRWGVLGAGAGCGPWGAPRRGGQGSAWAAGPCGSTLPPAPAPQAARAVLSLAAGLRVPLGHPGAQRPTHAEQERGRGGQRGGGSSGFGPFR
jgi:hypothetical protein